MALIKCPECGREKVSSTADSCPSCGYGIKAHFERLEKKRAAQIIQQQKEATKNSREAEVERKYTEYLHNVKQEQQEIDNITKPKKPNYLAYLFEKDVRIITLLVVVGPLLTFLFCYAAEIDSFLLILYVALGVLASPVWLIWSFITFRTEEVQEYKKELELFNNDRKEWERQKQKKKANIEARYRQQAKNDIEMKYNPPTHRTTNTIKCPVCGGGNVQKITTMDRSFSIAMVGMASGKIGKQYKCNNCKHMW